MHVDYLSVGQCKHMGQFAECQGLSIDRQGRPKDARNIDLNYN
jgi:hypothetical protein